jgi:hypothetical protein
MASKQARAHSPHGSRYCGIDRAGVHRLLIPSESRPGKWHTLLIDAGGVVISCSCEGYAAAAGDATRRLCWHALAAQDLLAHHLDPPPADPGGAARPDPGFATPLDPDDEGPFAGGAALARAQGALDAETRAWTEPPELAGLTACEDAARDEVPSYPYPLPTLDEAVELAGNRWIQSRTAAGVRLVCASCGAVRGWATEVGAIDWLATDGRCSCGGTVPTPPAPGAARKPLDDCLLDLYGG